MMSRKILKNVLIAAVILAALMLAACDTPSRKQQNAANEERAKANAVKYIENKYGFTPKVLKSETDRIPGGYGGTATDYVNVTCEYGGKEFIVNIYGASDVADGCDTYQEDEILADMKKVVEDNIPGLESIFWFKKQKVNDITNYRSAFFSVKYDKNNLKEAVADGLTGFQAAFADIDLENTAQYGFVKDYFPDEEREVYFVHLRRTDVPGKYDDYYRDYAPFSYGYYNYSLQKAVYLDYKEFDGLLYCALPDGTGRSPEVTLTAGSFDVSQFAHTKTETITAYSAVYTVTAGEYVDVLDLYFLPKSEEDLQYDKNRYYAIARRLEYADGTVKTDRMFGTAVIGGYLRKTISVPKDCKVTFGLIEVHEAD
ncbi:MAG: hypothetical protein J6113_07235 [Lachnospiraceae bacterium]|nr:hypothetical protein [Lachnospiraceae bacterium]